MRRCEAHFIQAGHCCHMEAMTLSGGKLASIIFPAIAGLFIHANEGAVLFDTGYDPAFFPATKTFPERFYRWLTPPSISSDSSVTGQLARFGLSTADVKWVILSHFHGDHIAGLHAFPAARIACSKSGLQAARTGGRLSAVLKGVLRDLIPAKIDDRLTFFEDCPHVALNRAFDPFLDGTDLLGDSSLIAVELPGHCPGHWGLVARGEDDALHFLAADAAWSSRAIRENRPPPRLPTAFLGDTSRYRETLARLHRLRTNAPELTITPSHCAERAAEIAIAAHGSAEFKRPPVR